MSESTYNDKQQNAQPGISTADSLLEMLDSKDGLQRQAARQQLVDMGQRAVPYLVQVLNSPNERARWETVKALGDIRDASAAPALVQALEDEESAIRWLAATGLIALRDAALRPLLEALESRANSVWMREGARHVLQTLIREGVADDAVSVLEALEDIEPAVEVPVAAYYALRRLRHGQQPELAVEGQESNES